MSNDVVCSSKIRMLLEVQLGISGLGCSSSLLVGPHIHSLLPPSQSLGVSHQGRIAVDGGPGTGQPPAGMLLSPTSHPGP